MNDLVSVVIPVFNVEKYLSRCLDSVLRQSYELLEIIIIDDGSTDSSPTICDKYAHVDNRLQIVHKHNEGLVKARKDGYEMSTGNLICSIDGDDWIEPNMIELLVDLISRENADVADCGYSVHDERGKKDNWAIAFCIDITSVNRDSLLDRWMKGENHIRSNVVTKLFRRSVFKKVYLNVPDDLCNGEDYIAYLYLLLNDIRIASIPDCLYNYIIRHDSMSHQMGANQVIKEYILEGYLLRLIRKNFHISEDVVNRWAIEKTISVTHRYIPDMRDEIHRYMFKDIERLRGRKIIIYGAGPVGHDYVLQISKYEDIRILFWVDKDPCRYNYSFRKVSQIDCIPHDDFDYIVIAIKKKEAAEVIEDTLISSYDVEKDKILWEEPGLIYEN